MLQTERTLCIRATRVYVYCICTHISFTALHCAYSTCSSHVLYMLQSWIHVLFLAWKQTILHNCLQNTLKIPSKINVSLATCFRSGKFAVSSRKGKFETRHSPSTFLMRQSPKQKYCKHVIAAQGLHTCMMSAILGFSQSQDQIFCAIYRSQNAN